MNSNRTYMHGYCSYTYNFFIFIFSLSPLSNYFSCSMSTTTSSFPNVYNNLAWQNKKKKEENNHPTTNRICRSICCRRVFYCCYCRIFPYLLPYVSVEGDGSDGLGYGFGIDI